MDSTLKTVSNTKRKDIKPWIILIVLPHILLSLTIAIQYLFNFSEDTDVVTVIAYIIMLLMVAFSFLAILGLPIWIILLVKAVKYNKELDKTLRSPTSPKSQSSNTNN